MEELAGGGTVAVALGNAVAVAVARAVAVDVVVTVSVGFIDFGATVCAHQDIQWSPNG